MPAAWSAFFAVILLTLSVMMAGCAGLPFSQAAYTFHGSRFEPPPPAADFALTDQDGRPAHLSDYRGKWILLFFGYTHCPDVCPTSLSTLNRVLGELGDASSQVQVLFVTVDPERDTPAVLKRYLSIFNPAFVGLTGRPEEVEAVVKAYGVYVEKEEVGSAAGYLVTHTARTYGIDPEGRLVLTFPFEMEPQDIAADLNYLLEVK